MRTIGPIKDAEIIASEGAITHYTDKEGKVSIQSRANGIILVEALGYEDIIVIWQRSSS